ncbi:M15 family metallopeptidase [Cellulosimicrobium terreum]|nr:M15 family metallopeptidase [Cellulosimicrobium terreum]
MAKTNNGFTLAPPASALATFTVNGLSFTVLKGDLTDVFRYIAEEFHNRVERVTHRSSYRTPSGNRGDADSNHMSATAIDLNGYWANGTPRHPYEILLPASKRGSSYDDGFTVKQVAEVREILAEVNGTTSTSAGVIQWGLDYRVPYRDAMHFQVRPGKKTSDIAAAAARVRRLRSPGANGPLVTDGRLGPKTISAWQRAEGSPVDGKISSLTSSLKAAVQRSINARNAQRKFLTGGPLKVTGRWGSRDRVAFVKYLNDLNRQHRFLTSGPLSTTKDLTSSRRNIALQKALNLGLIK